VAVGGKRAPNQKSPNNHSKPPSIMHLKEDVQKNPLTLLALYKITWEILND